MIIYGWGKETNDLGIVGETECSNCNNVATFKVFEVKSKATVYFVSVASWGHEYYCACSICGVGVKLKDRATAIDVVARNAHKSKT